MTFHSVLFPKPDVRWQPERPDPPDYFVDLHLDRVIDAITARWATYNLKPYFFAGPLDADTIRYRQAIMKDLECGAVLDAIRLFARAMHLMRNHLEQAERLYYRYQKKRWFLDAVHIYCTGIGRLRQDLDDVDLESRGLLDFRDFLRRYIESESFTALLADTKAVLQALSALHYSLVIKDFRVQVQLYDGEDDYSAEIEKTFAKFQQYAVEDYRFEFANAGQSNHVQEAILERLARLHPGVFAALDRYYKGHGMFLDETITAFDREIHFYMACLDYLSKLQQAGLPFCYPEMTNETKEIYSHDGFDLGLADKLVSLGVPVVCNDFYLKGRERIFVVTGPNQGGKTTFARAFGQMHYLAGIGCPVPGRKARLFLFDQIFTHFEKEENITDLQGHLADELIRIRSILDKAAPNSIVILNETFNSTTLKDATSLSKKVIGELIERDSLGVFVTFIDELTV
ncbi:MAG: hypothetical protein WD535_04505, partial [Thermaerobacterales bacterium]